MKLASFAITNHIIIHHVQTLILGEQWPRSLNHPNSPMDYATISNTFKPFYLMQKLKHALIVFLSGLMFASIAQAQYSTTTILKTPPAIKSKVYSGSQGVINNSERVLLQNFLNITETGLIKTIQETPQKLWIQKPSAGQWSMSQCLTHILQAEKGLFMQIKKLLQQPANPALDLRDKDAWLISKIADRGVRVKTPLNNAPEPTKQEEGIVLLKKSRQAIKAFLENKDLPLRNHFGRSPYGKADTYQLLLVIATHSIRHHAQMQEVLKALKK